MALNADAAAHPTNWALELNNALRLLTLQTGTQILVLVSALNQKMPFLAHRTVQLMIHSLPTGSQTNAVADVNEKKKWLDLTSAQVQINLIGLALNADAAAHQMNSALELNNAFRLLKLQTGMLIHVLVNALSR